MQALVIDDRTAQQLYEKASQCPVETVIDYIDLEQNHACRIVHDQTSSIDGIVLCNTHPRPIKRFLGQADWQRPFFHLIVLTQHGKQGFAAWMEYRGRITPHPVYIGDMPAQTPIDDRASTQTEKITYIFALTAAFLIVLLTAYALLPPAPTLP